MSYAMLYRIFATLIKSVSLAVDLQENSSAVVFQKHAKTNLFFVPGRGRRVTFYTHLSMSPLWSERHPHLLKQNLLSPAMWQDPCLPLQSYTIIALIMSWFANDLCSRIPEGADSKCSLLASKPELPNHSLEDCACGMCSNKFHSWVSSILKFKNKALDQRAYRGHSLWQCIWGNHPLVSEEEKGNAWEVMKR